jgi:hypothetical protein
MTTTEKRAYNSKDVEMLIATSTIVQSAMANKIFLQSKRASWADPFFDDLQLEIDLAIKNHLGIDSAKDLRYATQAVVNIQSNAIKDLAEVKVQVTEDFKNDSILLTNIINQLGFAAYHKSAQRGDQEALINLLFQFKTNLSTELRTEIVARGTTNEILDRIISYAEALKAADITQESSKGFRKIITAASIAEFNRIYNKVISVARISSNFFKDNPAARDQFSFGKVSKTINASKQSVAPSSKKAA